MLTLLRGRIFSGWRCCRNRLFGFRERHRSSAAKADRLYHALRRIKGLTVLPRQLNMVAAILDQNLPPETHRALVAHVVNPFFLMSEWCSADPEDPREHARRYLKFNVTVDQADDRIGNCTAALASVLEPTTVEALLPA